MLRVDCCCSYSFHLSEIWWCRSDVDWCFINVCRQRPMGNEGNCKKRKEDEE